MNTAAFILLGIGVLLSFLNWICVARNWLTKRHISPVFPAPSLLTALGLALFDRTRSYWWVGLLTDYTLFSLVFAAPSMIAGAWRTSGFTRIQVFTSESRPRRFELSLHRSGHFLLRATFEPAMPCNHHGASVRSFNAAGRWQDMLDGGLRLWGYREDRVLTLARSDADYVCHEQGYPKTEFPYDSLDGLKFRHVTQEGRASTS